MGGSLTGAAINVLTPMPDRTSALALARSLLEARLAACVSVGAPVESLYHWRGQIETTRNGAGDPGRGEDARESRRRGREPDSLTTRCRRAGLAPS